MIIVMNRNVAIIRIIIWSYAGEEGGDWELVWVYAADVNPLICHDDYYDYYYDDYYYYYYYYFIIIIIIIIIFMIIFLFFLY